MNFAAPSVLWLLLLIVLPLILFFWWSWRKRAELITKFTSARLLGHLKIGVSPSRQKFRMALIVVAVALLIAAVARPRWGFTQEEARQKGLDIVIAIDTSKSMLAADVPPDRLTRAKLAALDLMRKARTDRLGLVAFAGTAFLECPLTLDDTAFSRSVDSLDTRIISQGGTALADAIDESKKAFMDAADSSKAVVLFTDGEDHDGEVLDAAKTAARDGIRIFTIGVGTPEGEEIRTQDEHGRVSYVQDEQGNRVKSRLNESLLRQVAEATGGFYLPLQGVKTMDTLYDHGLAPLPKTANATRSFQHFHERFHWPLLIAIILLVFEMFIPDRKLRRSRESNGAPSAATAKVAALLFIFALPALSFGSPAGALREYEAGKYEDALKDYNHLLEQKKDDPRLNFNAGAAAYQSHQWNEAASRFDQALRAQDLQLQQRAYYNLGNAYFRLGESGGAPGQDPANPSSGKDATIKAWEQAVKHYESALKLNPKDADASYNLEFVKRQLEELKKQQQQQQQQQKQNQNNKDSKDNSNQQQGGQNQDSQSNKQDQSKGDQNSQAQNQKNQDQQQNKPDQEKPQDQKQKDEAQDKQQDQQQKQKQQQQQQNSGQGNDKDKSKEDAQRAAAMAAAGQMTPQQANQLLDAQKGDDKVLMMGPDNKNTAKPRSFKDW